MTPFEEAMASELIGLMRLGVPARGVRLTVREMVVARFQRGPLGAREVSDAVEATVRAACRLVRELDAPEEVVEAVCRAALDAVRGHGGESARWRESHTEGPAPESARSPARTATGRRSGPRAFWHSG